MQNLELSALLLHEISNVSAVLKWCSRFELDGDDFLFNIARNKIRVREKLGDDWSKR